MYKHCSHVARSGIILRVPDKSSACTAMTCPSSRAGQRPSASLGWSEVTEVNILSCLDLFNKFLAVLAALQPRLSALLLLFVGLAGPGRLPSWLKILAAVCSDGGMSLMLNVGRPSSCSVLGICPICMSVGGRESHMIRCILLAFGGGGGLPITPGVGSQGGQADVST